MAASLLSALVHNLCERFPGLQVAGSQASRFRPLTAEEKLEVAQTIANSGARLTFVGLGCPCQEAWVYEYHNLLSMPLIVVGAAFGFHAGTSPQAPEYLQRFGLEWLLRFSREPRRLWSRYLLLNPYYSITESVLFDARFPAGLQTQKVRFICVPPTSELRFG
jgi:N-acetylglucosaminyldiphosphoundecaprenol N-acetyl-beta-D-mannosaminyltransferase